jgi:hypothetical protein
MLAGTGAAATPSHRAGLLPPVGAEVPSSIHAVNSTFEYPGKTYTLDFSGGIKHRIEANPSDPNKSVRLRTLGFRVNGKTADGFSVTIEQGDADVDAKSTLTVKNDFPPSLEEHDVIPVEATITEPGHTPVVLQAKDPLVTSARLTRYPPDGKLYNLAKPLQLVEAGHPNKVVGTLTKFQQQRGGL